jgi:tRNA(Ile2) C34 agmatinyltransferase TiaS
VIGGKIVLPYREIKIGLFKSKNLNVDILAKIILEKENTLDSALFLKRVEIASPFCPHCSRNLDFKRASWVANGGQTGYKCPKCSTEINVKKTDLLKDVNADIRKNYESYWAKYKKEIKKITHNKPKKYLVPKY